MLRVIVDQGETLNIFDIRKQFQHYRLGDGACDDECNYGDCAYDGGDCCKPDADKTYCTECQCKTDTICPPVCIEMKGDGTCDDYCNTLNCEYDGGDCCGDNVQCGPGSSDCQCLNGAITTTTTATTTTTTTTTTTRTTTTVGQGSCNDYSVGYCDNRVGDNFCDDECNFSDCGYDGGDCCGPNVDTRYCYDCVCKANGK